MKKILIFSLCIYISVAACAQSDVFCNAITTIMHDAPNKFRNIRGNLINANQNATIWACGIQVPGTVNARFVASMGLFYEGALLQTKDTTELKVFYLNYKALLDTCLTAQGYTLSLQPNFYPGLSRYKKLVYLADTKDDSTAPEKAPPHVTLETAYSKEAGYYTLVMYIFEH